jgi:hypothetical protein
VRDDLVIEQCELDVQLTQRLLDLRGETRLRRAGESEVSISI